MNDPLAKVNPYLRRWLTPEFVKSLRNIERPLGYSANEYPNFNINGGLDITISLTNASPCLGKFSVVVDPSKPWPPRPEYKFGDKVTSKEGKGVVLDLDAGSRLDVFVRYQNLASWELSSDLTPGWSDE